MSIRAFAYSAVMLQAVVIGQNLEAAIEMTDLSHKDKVTIDTARFYA